HQSQNNKKRIPGRAYNQTTPKFLQKNNAQIPQQPITPILIQKCAAIPTEHHLLGKAKKKILKLDEDLFTSDTEQSQPQSNLSAGYRSFDSDPQTIGEQSFNYSFCFFTT
ncbi:unnamed protein product, partial [Timema podura]|nr:unnamed protein product [Timema podura]